MINDCLLNVGIQDEVAFNKKSVRFLRLNSILFQSADYFLFGY